MKHILLTTANGLLTPCGTSQSKSTRFSLFTSLLLFFLLLVGSNAAWALDYYVVGENWTSNSESAGWDKKGNNNFKMTKSGDVWYYKISNVSSSTNLQIKIRPSDDTEGWEKHLYYGANHDTQNRGNVTLVESTNVEDKRRFAFQPSENSDVYLYTDGSQVWANAVPAGSTSLSGHTIKLRGDLWQNPTGSSGGNAGWGDFVSCPILTVAPAGELARVSFLIPAVPSSASASAKARFELYDNGSKKDIGDANVSVSGATKSYSSGKVTLDIPKSSDSHLVTKQVNLVYTSGRYTITVTNPTLTGDWYLYFDKVLQSGVFENASGSIIVNNVATDNGGSFHSVFIANSNTLTTDQINSPTGQIPQGVVWLGGLYLDKAGSSASGITWESKQYRANSDGFSTYDDFSIKDKGDGRGAFKLSVSGNTMFSLNNGVITIKKQGDYTAAVTFTSQSYLFFNKAQALNGGGSHGNFPQDNAHCYFYVWNTNTSAYAYSDEAFYWDNDILIAKMPAGEWTHCILFRRGSADKNVDGCWNKTADIQLEEGKNYLTTNAGTTWQNYTPRFYIASSGGAISGGGDWTWNGNGTLHEGSFTKNLSAGTYKFKVTPYVNSSGSTNTGWGTELNMDRFNSTLSNVSCWDGNNKEIWFTLTESKDVTIAVSENGVTVNAEDPATPAPDPVTYDGSEIFYFHKKGGSLNWGSVWADDCALFLLFSNADESSTARSTKVGYFWDTNNTSGDVLATRVPAGTWSKVKVIRTQNENRNNVWNESNYVTLEEGKNYLNDNNTMAVYSPRTFHFYISGSTALANTGSDFNAWNGNGTAHSGSIEKLLEAGTYKFKLNPTGTVDWRSEFNTDDLDAVNSSNNINLRNGNNKEIWFDLSAKSNVTITCNGSKVTVVAVPVQQYTVTFNSNGGSAVAAQSVSDGSTATAPDPAPTKDGYTFVKWQKNGADYSFSTPVTADIQLDAVWAYKAISGVSLNESEHITWVGNSDFTLTPAYDPSDLIAKSVVWSSDNTGAASVSNGTVHAVSAGTATITCTVTDQFDNVRSATCEVTVAACEMTTDNLYSMTVTGYTTSSVTGGSATLTGLWNSSEPATITICNVRIGNNGGSDEYYAYDNNGTVMIEQRTSDDVDKWQMIATGTANVYYLKNISTGKYMYCGATNTSGSKGNGWSGNGDWLLRSVYTSTTNAETDSYKFYSAKDDWNNDIIISRADASNGAKATATDFVLSRQQLTGTPGVWSDVVANTVSASRGATQGGNTYKGFQSSFVNIENIANPAYIPSQMNSSYYRMNTNATVQANLAAALVKGAVITVSLYADAATSVKLEKTDGTEIATINLNTGAALEYSYTVNAVSALLGQSAFVIKAADNHAAIASIAVARTYAASPSTPDLVWESDLSSGVSQSVMAGNFVHTASSSESSGAISYTSSNTSVATVASDGTVTPKAEGPTTITATIEAAGCYAEYNISYNLTLTGATLAELIAANSELTLQYNYNEDAVINKTITIDGNGHSIGNLTIETAGDLTLTGNLTVKDFTICAKAGNTSNPAASGQVHNANNLTSIGNAYFLYTVDPSGTVHYGWYDFTVPFPVNVMTGIKGIQEGVLKENFVNETDYAIMEHLGDKQAAGQYAYKKFRGIMQPCRLYSITLDDDYNYNTIRFQKTNDGALVAGNSVTLNSYPAGEAKHANWNGVGNGTLHHADAEVSTVGYIQVYQSGTKTFLPVDRGQYSLVVGSAFMIQQAGTMTLNQATHDKLLAPKREASVQPTAIQIASEGKPFSDQLFISASETGGQTYTQGIDLAKAGDFGKANVPQIGTNAYNTLLCVHEAQLIGGQAEYALSLYAPANGTYMLTSKNIPEDKSIYLTQNGNTLCNLSDSYALDLTKGITTEYGLLLVETHKVPTDVDNVQSDNVQSTKIIRNGMLYILRNGEIFNAQGARVQ